MPPLPWGGHPEHACDYAKRGKSELFPFTAIPVSATGLFLAAIRAGLTAIDSGKEESLGNPPS